MLLHFLSITHSFLYTNLISIAKVITRFILLCHLFTKLIISKTLLFFSAFPNFFHKCFLHHVMNNTFKLSLISLLEFVFPHCYLNAIPLWKIMQVKTEPKHLYKNLSWFWERAENNLKSEFSKLTSNPYDKKWFFLCLLKIYMPVRLAFSCEVSCLNFSIDFPYLLLWLLFLKFVFQCFSDLIKMKKLSESNSYMATTNEMWFSVGGINGVTYKLPTAL